MIITSLVAVVVSAAAAVGPFSSIIHLHPKQTDSRISVTLCNQGNGFRDVRVDGHTYTINQHGTLTIKAPAGTVVYAASRTPLYKRGDIMLQVTPQIDKTRITVL